MSSEMGYRFTYFTAKVRICWTSSRVLLYTLNSTLENILLFMCFLFQNSMEVSFSIYFNHHSSSWTKWMNTYSSFLQFPHFEIYRSNIYIDCLLFRLRPQTVCQFCVLLLLSGFYEYTKLTTLAPCVFQSANNKCQQQKFTSIYQG